MQRLILMRHAEAETPRPGLGDQARPLSQRGRREAAGMARLLAEKACRADLALVSPALRTRQTWDIVHESFGDVDVHALPELYNADAHQIDRLIARFDDQASCLIVITHNPGVHLLATRYLEEGAATPAVLDRLGGGFPTAAAAVFTIDAAGRRVLEGYFHPPAIGE